MTSSNDSLQAWLSVKIFLLTRGILAFMHLIGKKVGLNFSGAFIKEFPVTKNGKIDKNILKGLMNEKS